MPRSEIPVDILLNILDYVDKAGLAAMCRVSKICCSYSQDVLYRDIYVETPSVQHTLARSTNLARRVRSFDSIYEDPDLATALRNMTSLRILKLTIGLYSDIFEGCTFKLDSFIWSHPDNKYFRKFLSSQPSLKSVQFDMELVIQPLEMMCLPNLSRFTGPPSWLPYIILGRPISEVTVFGDISRVRSLDLSILTLATTPIRKFTIDYPYLYPTPVHILASIFPSLTYFNMSTGEMVAIVKNHEVC
jgi:hypothetical protein